MNMQIMDSSHISLFTLPYLRHFDIHLKDTLVECRVWVRVS